MAIPPSLRRSLTEANLQEKNISNKIFVCIYGRLKLGAVDFRMSMAGNEALLPVFNYSPVDIICRFEENLLRWHLYQYK